MLKTDFLRAKLPPGREPRQDDQGRWVVVGLALHEAEALLDWLEGCGCRRREVVFDPSGLGVSVRWE